MSIYCPDHLRDILIAIAATAYISHGIYIFILGVLSTKREPGNRKMLAYDLFFSYVQAATWPLFYYRMWRYKQEKSI